MKYRCSRSVKICLLFIATLLTGVFFFTETPFAMQPYEVIEKNPEKFLVNQGPAMCASTAFYMIFKYYGDADKNPSFFYDEKGKPLDLSENEAASPSSKKKTHNKNRLEKGSKMGRWINPMGGATKWSRLKEGAENIYYRKAPGGPLVRYYNVIDSHDPLIHKTKKNQKIKKDLMENRILPLLEQNRPVLVHLSRANAPGHYIVVIGYDKKSGNVYYVDPNEKDLSRIVRKIDYDAFANTRWYVGNVPKLWGNAGWSGKFLSFAHK